ncbi:hypothetical protein [Mycolicibacterium conceptionense]|uniref:hypothetical protein n=1 Tax=Mycolicibacterium conceptionense TaxID=451644 RepID=UPI000A3EAB74|nr:hypothetical protein [Mycolicibacterium conceptionense]
MTSPDRAATESKIHQLISEMEMSLQSLQRGVDVTHQLWRGQAGDQFASSVHDEQAAGRALLDEMRTTVAAPPWDGAGR